MSMNVIIRITTIAILLCTINSCKDKPLFDSIPGEYTVCVEVIRRPAVYPKVTASREGYFEYFHGAYIDPGPNSVCCQDWGDEHGCPMTYSFDPFEIIKNGDGYAIKNDTEHRNYEGVGKEGKQVFFHIPLQYDKGTLSFEGCQIYSRSRYIGKFNREHSEEDRLNPWPVAFSLHYFKIKKKNRNTLEGEWFFMDQTSGCQFSTLGESALMGEYAKITLTKIK